MLTFRDLAETTAVDDIVRSFKAGRDFCAHFSGTEATLLREAKRDEPTLFALKIRLGAVVLTQGALAAEALVAEMRHAQDAANAGDTPQEMIDELLSRQDTGAKRIDLSDD